MHTRKPHVDIEVLAAMRRAHAKGYDVVFASMLVAWLDIERDERSVKRDLRRLAAQGMVQHMDQRGGYKLKRENRHG